MSAQVTGWSAHLQCWPALTSSTASWPPVHDFSHKVHGVSFLHEGYLLMQRGLAGQPQMATPPLWASCIWHASSQHVPMAHSDSCYLHASPCTTSTTCVWKKIKLVKVMMPAMQAVCSTCPSLYERRLNVLLLPLPPQAALLPCPAPFMHCVASRFIALLLTSVDHMCMCGIKATGRNSIWH